ncbi:MAG: hypothetical protein ABIQ44_01645, partial [Chloroflexia bacterium]
FTTRIGDPAYLGTTRYVITLDSDTDLPRDAAHRLIGTLAHPLNHAEVDPVSRTVVTGYGILQPRVESTWESTSGSLFAKISSGHTGVDPYTTAVSNAYQDLFGEGIFIGKGIYDVDAFEVSTTGRFPANTVLSHDLLEGAFARVGFASDITLYEGFPSRYSVFAARAHRWVRGDWQIAQWAFRKPITPINRWKIADNLRRSLVAPASVGLLALGWSVPALSPLFWSVFILLVFGFPFYSHLVVAIPRKPAGTEWGRHFIVVMEDALTNLLYLVLNLVFLAHTAYLMVDAVVRTLVRMFVTHRHLLEWVTASESQRTLGTSPLDSLKRMWQAPLIAALAGAAVIAWRPEALFVATPWLVAWLLSPLIAYWVSTARVAAPYVPTEDERLYLRRIARKSWRYFDEFIGEKDRWLAPDNYQEFPKGELAHRTSPTNLSLLLLSTLSAYDLGYVTLPETLSRIDRTLQSMEGLEKYNGHLYNWYETQTGQALPPKYISMVDSGNLVGHLLALKNGCVEMLDAPLFSTPLVQNLLDLTEIMKAEVGKLIGEHMRPMQTAQRATLEAIGARIDAISLIVQATTPQDLIGWANLRNALMQPVVNLATETRRLLGERGWERPTARGEAMVGNKASVEELAAWADSMARAVQGLDQDMRGLVPWANMLESAPDLLTGDKQPQIANQWANLKKLPDPVPSINSAIAWCN